ncbi:MAG: hypothetical protein HQK61_03110 [Desulfamplus sp.]|nr:hypothetical protein [Desulfamplus sp.]
MSNISNLGSSVGGLRNRGDLAEFGSLSEKREALQASQSKSLELSLTTKEGDTVTLSAGSFMDFASMSYDKSGRISNGSQSASGRISTREMTLSSGSQFSFSVKGSLSEQEMDDIENIVKTLDEIVSKMSTGDMDDALAKALEMQDGYDTVSGFEANLSTSSSYSFEKEISRRAYAQGQGNPGSAIGRDGHDNHKGVLGSGLNQDENLPELPKDSSTRLMDMMLKELEKLQEKDQSVLRKAAQPVDQLLAHHMDQLKTAEGKEKGENQDIPGPNQNGLTGNKNGLNRNDNTRLAGTDDNRPSDAQEDMAGRDMEKMFNELADTRKAMAQEFRKMMPEPQSFRQMASSFFDNA